MNFFKTAHIRRCSGSPISLVCDRNTSLLPYPLPDMVGPTMASLSALVKIFAASIICIDKIAITALYGVSFRARLGSADEVGPRLGICLTWVIFLGLQYEI